MNKLFWVFLAISVTGFVYGTDYFLNGDRNLSIRQHHVFKTQPVTLEHSTLKHSDYKEKGADYFFDEKRNRSIRQRLFWETQPVTLKNCTLKRYGSKNDGGYLMCQNLMSKVQSAYSYGIEGRDEWGCDISKELHVNVHQYDCFDPRRPVCENGQFTFHDECIGDSTQIIDGRPFDSLKNQIIKNKDEHNTLIVKMDVELAEWDSLWATPDEVLHTIDQLIVEFHAVNEEKYIQVMQKLKRTFYIVNIHFNNCGCSDKYAPFPSRSREILFVNKRIAKLDLKAPKRIPPHPLTTVNCRHAPDCQIDMGDYVIDARRKDIVPLDQAH